MQDFTSRIGTFGRRGCALLAVCAAGLHGIAVTAADGVVPAVLLAGMALACLYCARELWARSATRAWVLVAVMNLAMIAVHLPSAAGHDHGQVASALAAPMHHSPVMTTAMALSAVEAVIATAVVYRHSRRMGSKLLTS